MPLSNIMDIIIIIITWWLQAAVLQQLWFLATPCNDITQCYLHYIHGSFYMPYSYLLCITSYQTYLLEQCDCYTSDQLRQRRNRGKDKEGRTHTYTHPHSHPFYIPYDAALVNPLYTCPLMPRPHERAKPDGHCPTWVVSEFGTKAVFEHWSWRQQHWTTYTVWPTRFFRWR